jgi:ABC-type polar amino acid transport system ATPase subunit
MFDCNPALDRSPAVEPKRIGCDEPTSAVAA